MAALEGKWEGQISEVAALMDRMAVFVGGRWFLSQMECVEFSEKHIPEVQFQ